MTQRLISILLLVGLMILAVLLYRSTASYPAYVQGSTASYVRFLGLTMGILCVVDLLLSLSRQRKMAEGEQTEQTGSTNIKRFWALLVLLIVYSLALDPIGFYACIRGIPAGFHVRHGRASSHSDHCHRGRNPDFRPPCVRRTAGSSPAGGNAFLRDAHAY